ncbi:hypothetical protein MMC31_005600 [Peltigera leucophlebia]|nr:hypothetical protein [Peltigera leucophlebia]
MEHPTDKVKVLGDSASVLPLSPYEGWKGKTLSPVEFAKVTDILAACNFSEKTHLLTTLATSEAGLVDDEVRRLAWPLLLGFDVKTKIEAGASQGWRELPRHKDEDQVGLDVHRSFIYYPKNQSEKQLDRRKTELSDVIIQVLRQYPMLSYFQGFHDIVQVFLLVLGIEHAAKAVIYLAILRIRDFMLPSLSPSLAHLRLLPSIIYVVDPALCEHLSQTQPFFALAATLTLYAHDIQEYGDIARLFDFLLAHGAVVSVYFFAIIVLSRREELFEIPADEPEMLHSVLSKLPKPLDLEALISRTMVVFIEHPPEKLPFRAWSRISPFSVLKTTIDPTKTQDLQEGQDLFEMQILQLRRAELMQHALKIIWKYRRPAASVGLAVFIGVVSFWLKKDGINGLLAYLPWKVRDFFKMLNKL